MRNTQAKIPVVFILKDNALKKAEKGLGHLEDRAKHFARSIAALALAGGIEEFARKSVEAAVKMEAANAKLGVALKNIGQSAALGGEAIKKTNEQMANLGFTGAESAQALANLVTVTHSLDKAQSLMGQAADVARYKQISLSDASIKLARATTGSSKGLAEFGIKLDKTLKPADAFKKAMRQLNAEISGQAAAYAGTYAGKLDILKAKFEEVQVQVGEALLPKLVELGDWLIKTGIPNLQTFFKFIGDNIQVLTGFAAALTAVALAFKAIGVYAGLAELSALPLIAAATPLIAALGGIAGITALIATAPIGTPNNAPVGVGTPMGRGSAAIALQQSNNAKKAAKAAPKFGNPMGRTFGGNEEKPAPWQLEQIRLAKEANALAAKKLKEDKKALQAKSINTKLSALFDPTQIELAAALQGKLTQEQIDKVKALQSLEDDGYTTADQQLANQTAALANILKLKQDIAQVQIMGGVADTSGTGVNGGGGEKAGGQTIKQALADAGIGNPGGSSVPTAPATPSPAITAAVTQLATSSTNGMTGRTASENPIVPAPQVSVVVQGSVTSETNLVDTIYNALNNKLRAGASFYNNAASGM